MNTLFVSENIYAREFTDNDTDFIIELLNSKGWLQFIGNRNINSKSDALHYFENVLQKSYLNNGWGLWLVALNTTNKPIGMCGFLKRDYLEDHDIGFAFLPEHEGKGYATEATNAALEYAKSHLNFKTVMAITTPDNERSIKLLKKSGFKFVKKIISSDTKEELFLFSN